jgi:hypothetical protein
VRDAREGDDCAENDQGLKADRSKKPLYDLGFGRFDPRFEP